MNFVISKTKFLYRSLGYSRSTNSNLESVKKTSKISFLTAVAGHDNKHTHYKTKLTPKWIYGDDACFISKTDTFCVMGVADGVGGWRSYGVDPSNFSKTIMNACYRIVQSGNFEPSNPYVLIEKVYDELLNIKKPIIGSATMCILSLCSKSNRLYAATLGDSGFLVLRNGRVIQRSELQKHAFNTPFQLACIPPNRHSMDFYRDAPDVAARSELHIKEGDMIVVGTDGLFDNLTDAMILQELETDYKSLDSEEGLKSCCNRLVSRAKEAAMNRNFFSPFASEARHYGLNILGGVPGDITVILGLVINSNSVDGLRVESHKVSSHLPSSSVNSHCVT